MSVAYATTVVTNNGATKYFSFLPPHGRVIPAGENIVYIGVLESTIPDNKVAEFEAAVQAEDITITHVIPAASITS